MAGNGDTTPPKGTLTIEARLGAASVSPADVAHRTRVVERYIAALNRADLDAVVELFAADTLALDPLGTPPIRGRDALRDFFANGPFLHRIKAALDGPVRVAGNAAAFAFTAQSDGKVMHIIDVFDFDDQGKIEKMVAYWSSANTS
ncbi:nuclear transport factor 2 family protein [Ruegeria jejuensis]|uniref:nuclear transport factor 2 family protein n=1 Tax=Ruegeria jejuensis TaxID=3233338 RepID=UPI00355C3D2F